MIVENKDGLTIIYAEAENKITNSQRTFFSDFIYLGKFDSVDNYEEVPRSVWKQFVKDDNPTLNGAIEDIQELQEKTNTLSETSKVLTEQVAILEETQLLSTETTDVIMYAVAESDEKLIPVLLQRKLSKEINDRVNGRFFPVTLINFWEID